MAILDLTLARMFAVENILWQRLIVFYSHIFGENPRKSKNGTSMHILELQDGSSCIGQC